MYKKISCIKSTARENLLFLLLLFFYIFLPNRPRFCLRFNVPVNNFSVMFRWSHRLLGINQCSGELMCLAPEHSDPSGD